VSFHAYTKTVWSEIHEINKYSGGLFFPRKKWWTFLLIMANPELESLALQLCKSMGLAPNRVI
jgi:hypothetical protein